MRFSLQCAAVTALAILLSPARGETKFSKPGPVGQAGFYRNNPSYTIGEEMKIEWTSDLESMDLVLWIEYPKPEADGASRETLQENSGSTSLDWTVNLYDFSTDVPDGESVILFFTVYETGSTGPAATSEYFNVTMKNEDKTTTSIESATESMSSTTQTGTTFTSTSAPSESTGGGGGGGGGGNDDKNTDGSLSTGAVVGIAVGATLGGIILALAAGFFLWRHFKGKKNTPAGITAINVPRYYDQYKTPTQTPPANVPQMQRSELPAEQIYTNTYSDPTR